MKTIRYFALICFCLTSSWLMGQEVVNGVLQGSPTSFMYLPTTAPTGGWNNSWVKPSAEVTGSYSSTFNYTEHMGAITNPNDFTHRFIVRGADPGDSPDNDPCYRGFVNSAFYNKPIMAEAWNSDIFFGTYVDTVIQMGMPGPNGQDPSGIYAQQIIYSFVPDEDNPVLLLSFAFNTEDAQHPDGIYHPGYEDNPGVEFAVLQHGTDNFLPLGNYDPDHPYSQFWFRTPSSSGTADPWNTPVVVPVSSLTKSDSCPCQYGVDNVFTYPYTIVAYNLSAQARTHTAVDFRVRVHACTSRYHWAYCYFTAKMVPAKLLVKYCGGDTLKLDIPWGFDANNYRWYNGPDSATVVQNKDQYWFDPGDATTTGIFDGSTVYHPLLRPNPARPYFRCETESYTGVPFTYEATVNYYDLQPSFTVESTALTDNPACDYSVVLHNTSKIGVIKPKEGGGLDTVWQDLQANPDQCTWNFGDDTLDVTGFAPTHTYTAPGTYYISLHITDFERVCTSLDTVIPVIIDEEFMKPQYAEDEVTTCENNLPYYYKPDIFGFDNAQTRWDWNAVGEREVNFSNAINPVKAWNGCDSIVKVDFDIMTPVVVIEQVGEDFCDSAKTTLKAVATNISDDVKYYWTFMDSIIGNAETLKAYADGTYEVKVVDTVTTCSASGSYKIDPCVPNVFLPNCITPSQTLNQGPAQNDYFYLDQFVLRFITDIKLGIYARNGEQVYYYEGKKNAAGEFLPVPPFGDLPAEMENRLVLWDGKCNGRIISGTYTYALWIVSGGQSYLYKGKLIVL